MLHSCRRCVHTKEIVMENPFFFALGCSISRLVFVHDVWYVYITLWAPFSCLTFFLALLFISFAGLLWNEPGPENNIVHLLSKFSPPPPSERWSLRLSGASVKSSQQTNTTLSPRFYFFVFTFSFFYFSFSLCLSSTDFIILKRNFSKLLRREIYNFYTV